MVYIVLEAKDRSGLLSEILQVFVSYDISLKLISSRQSRIDPQIYEFVCEFDAPYAILQSLTDDLSKLARLKETEFKGHCPYPRCLEDLDGFSCKTLEFGSELSADHPGFTDEAYRKRRAEITLIAQQYRTGMAIPEIEYTAEELQTWGVVWDHLTKLFESHACAQHQTIFPLLIKECGYSRDRIPQLQSVSQFLRKMTGFTLRPVMGLLSSRDFLNGLAFRVFHSTQYIRHSSAPLYTPEPDVCHELLGHVPLFADEAFASFSQEIGLASLGASDEEIKKLATIYWFTVEFGVCREGDGLRAYGAGLLSSAGELEYSLSGQPELIEFDPNVAACTEYPITQYQPKYFVAASFTKAQMQVREYAKSRPGLGLNLRYDALTGTIREMWREEERSRLVDQIQRDLYCLGR